MNTGALPTPSWHYEYGSATAFFVLPREGRAAFLSAARGNAPIAPVGGGGATVAAAPHGGRRSDAEVAATGGLYAEDVPVDENGVRDMRQVTVFCSPPLSLGLVRD